RQGPDADADTDQQRACGAGEGQFGGAVHREGHLPGHHQRRQAAGDQAERGRGQQRLLHERVGEQVRGDAEVEDLAEDSVCSCHGSSASCTWWSELSAPATTRRSPTRATSIRVPYSSDSTSEVMTSSGGPTRNLPFTR